MRGVHYVPELLAEGPYFYSEKYVNGNSLDSIYTDFAPFEKSDLEDIASNISEVVKIKSRSLQHRQPWQNCQEFFLFQINHTIDALHHQSRRIPLWRQAFGIDWPTVAVLDDLPHQIDRTRPLCFIHGDRQKNKMIRSGDRLYFIGWEYACIGDLAYELAFHIYQMKYTETDLAYLFNCLEQRLPVKLKTALKDIEVYMKYITLRSVMYYMRILQECAYTKRSCEKFYYRLFQLAQYPEFGVEVPTFEEVQTIIKRLKTT